MIDYLNPFSEALLTEFYTRKGETVPQAFERAAFGYLPEDKRELGSRILDYVNKGWFMFSSPVLSNAPLKGEKLRAMPISCYKTLIPDQIDGQLDASSEMAALSVSGGGIGTYIDVRAVSEKAPGPIPYIKTIDANIAYYRQSKTRKGSVAIYMEANHPDVVEFIKIRIPTGGDPARKVDNRKQVHNAICYGKDFVNAIDQDLEWPLVDPHSREVKDTIRARELWELILDTRALTGEPYLFHKDNVNEQLHPLLKEKGLEVKSSNLCVHGDTHILTDNGYFPISDLEGQSVTVWNGFEWSDDVIIRKTNTDQKLREYFFSNGQSIKCTDEHKFYLKGKSDAVDAKDLKEGDIVDNFYVPAQQVGIDFHNTVTFYGEVRGVTVTHIEDVDGLHDTYCATEPKNNTLVFNGIMTGNCSEIIIPTDEKRTAVCCLSSVNLEFFDDWSVDDSTFIADCVEFLDYVLEYFIQNAEPHLKKAVYAAKMGRDLGLGAMGFHYYLQKNNIAFESGGIGSAVQANNRIFHYIKKEADKATIRMGLEKGQAPDVQGSMRRNVSCIAIAPNANSGSILNTSPSIDPITSNCFAQSTRVGTYVVRNKYLEKVLRAYCPYDADKETWLEEQWKSISQHHGSVQHLDYLSDAHKKIFKTAYEIDQHWVIQHAEDRAPYIDQSQPVNIFFPAGTDKAYFNSVHLKGIRSKTLKTMYYCRMEREMQVNSLEKHQREALVDWNDKEKCHSCEG
jgi:ribonucleotide reductase alpha subunit